MATYISKQSGLWSSATTWLTAAAGTYTPTADAGTPPQSGGNDKIIIRGTGTVVEYDVNGMFGDGTSYYPTAMNNNNILILSNGICLSGGILRASRTISTSLTANGTIAVGYLNNPWFDWGTTTDPITGVTASLILGAPTDTNSLKFGIYAVNSTAPDNGIDAHKITIVGKSKTKNAQLDRFHSTGTSTLSVLNCDGWEIGDRVVVEVPYLNITTPANTIGNITNINGNVVTINTTLNANCPSGTYVGNFSSNITIRPGMSAVSVGGNCNAFGIQFNLNGNGSFYEFKNFSAIDFNGVPSGGAIINIGAVYGRREVTIDGVSFFSTNNMYGINWSAGTGYQHSIKNIAFYSPHGGSYFANIGLAAQQTISDCVVYRASTMANMVNCLDVNWNNIRSFTTAQTFGSQLYSFRSNMNNCSFRVNSNGGNQFALSYYNQKYTINNCYFQGVNGNMIYSSEASALTMDFKNCTLSSVNVPIVGLNSAKTLAANFYTLNGNNLYNRRLNSYYTLSGNYSLRNRGLASYDLISLKSNVQHYFTETIPSKANISQRYIGYLRYQSAYGNTNLPYIQFTDESNTSSVTKTFSCSPIPDQWQKFDLTINPITDGNITMTVYTQTSSTSTRVYLDGLTFDPINPRSRHYGFVFDSFSYRTVNTLTTLTENQVSAISTINNLDYLYDAANYWSVTNPSLTAYTDLYTQDGNIIDFGSRNIIIDNSASTSFAYASASSTLTIKTPLLSSGSNFIGLKTTGNIYLSSGSTIGEIDIYGNVFQATPVSLSGIYMEGTLAYNTNSNTTIEYTDCTMDTVQNDGTGGIVTIKKTNSTIANGLDAEIADFIPTILNVILNGGYLAVYDDTGTRQYYQNTDGTIVLPSNATGTWTYKIARYGYQFNQGSFIVDPNTGATIEINPNYVPDNFVTSDPATVAGYGDLNTSEKIYNYLNYWTTTSSGIDYVPFYSKAFGSITINKNVVLDATAVSVLSYDGSSILTLKCSGLNEDILFASNSSITNVNGTTYSDDVKIRAANLNSELILGGITSFTLYPTQSARDNNTSIGPVLTGTIDRFLYGSVSTGVTLSGGMYARVLAAGTTLLYENTFLLGRNELEFGTTGSLQQIISNQKIMNIGIQKASKLIPYTTNI